MRRALVSIAGTALLSMAAIAAASAAADFTPLPQIERVMVTAPRPIADFQLTAQDGKPLRLSALRGRPVLVFFGFAHCPDVCPMALQKLSALQQSAAKEMKSVRVVMISIDGDRDTPEAMRDYLRAFSPNFLGLTGPVSDVREIASQFSATFFKDAPRSDGTYTVEHTARVFALDRKGRLRAELFDASVDATAQVVRALLTE
jgi:protein SCO1